MVSLNLTTKEVLSLESAICCKIVMCEKYANTLKMLSDNGMDVDYNLENQEAEIKMYKELYKKIMEG